MKHPKPLRLTDDGIIFTMQAEGRFCGFPTIFVRLSTCNLRCQWTNPDGTVTTCDTPYSSHEPENKVFEQDEIYRQCMESHISHIVITGGEAMMQPAVDALMKRLTESGKHVTLETNGTIYRDVAASFVSISPKLSTSSSPASFHHKIHERLRTNYEVLSKFVQKYPHQLKFVINTMSDLLEVDEIIATLRNRVSQFHPDSTIMIMPMGITVKQLDERLAWLVPEAIKRGWVVADRLHIRLWGDMRGV